jgi:hypothetical protein
MRERKKYEAPKVRKQKKLESPPLSLFPLSPLQRETERERERETRERERRTRRQKRRRERAEEKKPRFLSLSSLSLRRSC